MQCHSELTLVGIARYCAGGWHALEDGRRSGRPRKVSEETMQCLYEAIRHGVSKAVSVGFLSVDAEHRSNSVEEREGSGIE